MIKEITVNTLAEFKTKLESKDVDIATVIYEAVKKGITRKYKSVGVFNVLLKKDPLSVYKFKLERSQWGTALNTCMEIFSMNDMFEECIEIQEFLKKLKE